MGISQNAIDYKNELRDRSMMFLMKLQSLILQFSLKFTHILLQTHCEQKEEAKGNGEKL